MQASKESCSRTRLIVQIIDSRNQAFTLIDFTAGWRYFTNTPKPCRFCGGLTSAACDSLGVVGCGQPRARCILATNDLPLTVKLTHREIEFMSLDESLLLPSEPDPLEKTNKQLEAELLRYKSR